MNPTSHKITLISLESSIFVYTSSKNYKIVIPFPSSTTITITNRKMRHFLLIHLSILTLFPLSLC